MKSVTIGAIFTSGLIISCWTHFSLHIVQPIQETAEVSTGLPLTIECDLSGTRKMLLAAVQITWQRSATLNLTPVSVVSDRIKYIIENSASENSLRSRLTVLNLTFSDEGVYYCRSHMRGSNLSDLVQITARGVPEIVNITTDRHPVVGRAVSFICLTVGKPRPSVVWLGPNDTNLTVALDQINPKYTISTTTVSDKMMVSQLTLSSVMSETQGNYTCAAESDAGKAIRSSELLLKAWVTFDAPSEDDPGNDTDKKMGDTGDTLTLSTLFTVLDDITLSCFAYNVPDGASVEWAQGLIEERILRSGLRYNISTNTIRTIDPLLSSVNSTLTFRALASDEGFYVCRVVDNQGTVLSDGVTELAVEEADDLSSTDEVDTLTPTPTTATTSGAMNYSDASRAVDAAVSGGIGAGTAVLVVLVVTSIVVFVRRGRKKPERKSQAQNKRESPPLKITSDIVHSNNAYSGGLEVQTTSSQSPVLPASRKKDSREFPRDRVQLKEILAQSKLVTLHHGLALNILNSGKWDRVAVKMLKETATDAEKSDFMREISLLRNMEPHPNIIRLLGTCTETEPSLIILEFCEQGNLLQYIRKQRPQSRNSQTPLSDVTSRDILSFALQIAKGMAHLAAHMIVHRDLAARNILLTERNVCKVSHFSLARHVDDEDIYESVSRRPLPLRWMSPESLRDGSFTSQSDVWSYGVLLWELVTLGASPYPDMTGKMVTELVTKGTQLQVPRNCPEDLRALIMSCRAMMAHQRPNFQAVVDMLESLMEMEGGYMQLGQLKLVEDHSVLESESSAEQI